MTYRLRAARAGVAGRTARRGRAGIAPRYLAGWLFADLFLVLFLIALGLIPASRPHPGNPPGGNPSSSASPSASASSSPGANGSGNGGKGPGGLDPAYYPAVVAFGSGATSRASGRPKDLLTDSDADRLVAKVEDEIRVHGKGRRIGMVLTFGLSPKSELEAAGDLAAETNRTLRARMPDAFCGNNVGMRDFWRGHDTDDAVSVEVYYINSCTAGSS